MVTLGFEWDANSSLLRESGRVWTRQEGLWQSIDILRPGIKYAIIVAGFTLESHTVSKGYLLHLTHHTQRRKTDGDRPV